FPRVAVLAGELFARVFRLGRFGVGVGDRVVVAGLVALIARVLERLVAAARHLSGRRLPVALGALLGEGRRLLRGVLLRPRRRLQLGLLAFGRGTFAPRRDGFTRRHRAFKKSIGKRAAPL